MIHIESTFVFGISLKLLAMFCLMYNAIPPPIFGPLCVLGLNFCFLSVYPGMDMSLCVWSSLVQNISNLQGRRNEFQSGGATCAPQNGVFEVT